MFVTCLEPPNTVHINNKITVVKLGGGGLDLKINLVWSLAKTGGGVNNQEFLRGILKKFVARRHCGKNSALESSFSKVCLRVFSILLPSSDPNDGPC